MSAYQALWLQLDRILELFAAHTLSEQTAREWLAEALPDRGIVCKLPADPSTDLFRLEQSVDVPGRLWKPDVGQIDLRTFTVVLWDAHLVEIEPVTRMARTGLAIEASAKILREELTHFPRVAPTRRRGVKPTKEPAVYAQMLRRINAGTLSLLELHSMGIKLLEEHYGPRSTAERARTRILKDLGFFEQIATKNN